MGSLHPLIDAAAAARSVPAPPVTSGPLDGPVAVVLPARNEAGSVAGVASRVPAQVLGRPTVVIVVDDWSTDDTAAEARSAGAIVTRPPEHRGLGAAVRHGFEVAHAHRPSAIVFLDADGEYRPEEIPVLVGPILAGSHHYVVGSRFAGHIERMPFHRRLGNRLLTRWVGWIIRQRVTDGQSGFRALSGAAARAARLANDYNYAQTLTVEMVGRGFGYHEVPISYRRRCHGRGFVRLGPYLRAVVPAVRAEIRHLAVNPATPATGSRPPRSPRVPLQPARPAG